MWGKRDSRVDWDTEKKWNEIQGVLVPCFDNQLISLKQNNNKNFFGYKWMDLGTLLCSELWLAGVLVTNNKEDTFLEE